MAKEKKRNNYWKFQIGKEHKPVDLRDWANPKKDKKKYTLRWMVDSTFENEKHLKSSQRKMAS